MGTTLLQNKPFLFFKVKKKPNKFVIKTRIFITYISLKNDIIENAITVIQTIY